ncbi:MAG TPA: hypothetical protein VHP30_09420, partial [Ignavibacteriales bacterium]|nr:hypothetical protein [Ignavibacteriales bacterium]
MSETSKPLSSMRFMLPSTVLIPGYCDVQNPRTSFGCLSFSELMLESDSHDIILAYEVMKPPQGAIDIEADMYE